MTTVEHNKMIYKITFPNGKCYVGQTNNYNRRIAEHRKKHVSATSDAINEFGWTICKVEILEHCASDNVNEREMHYIKINNAIKNGYNKDIRGSALPHGHSDEFKYKISILMKGRIFTKEHRTNISIAQKGRKCSTETKANCLQ